MAVFLAALLPDVSIMNMKHLPLDAHVVGLVQERHQRKEPGKRPHHRHWRIGVGLVSLRQASRAIRPRPVATSGSVAGSGTACALILSTSIPVARGLRVTCCSNSPGAPIQPRNKGTSWPPSPFGYDTL